MDDNVFIYKISVYITPQRDVTRVINSLPEDEAKKVIDSLPEDSTYEEILRELASDKMIVQGLDDIENGKNFQMKR